MASFKRSGRRPSISEPLPIQRQIANPPAAREEHRLCRNGSKSTGEVTYRASGKGQIPVWKGKLEFFVINHEKKRWIP